MKKDNNILYEKLINNISREVKNALNEARATTVPEQDVKEWLYGFAEGYGFYYSETLEGLKDIDLRRDVCDELDYNKKQTEDFINKIHKFLDDETIFDNMIDEMHELEMKKQEKSKVQAAQAEKDAETYLYELCNEFDFDYDQVKFKINGLRIEDITVDYNYTSFQQNKFKERLYELISNEDAFEDFIKTKSNEDPDFAKSGKKVITKKDILAAQKKVKVKALLQELIDLDVKVKIDGPWGGNYYDIAIDDNGNIRLNLNRHDLD